MTQEEIYELHRKQREADQKRVDAHDEKRDKLTEMFRAQSSFPVTQHPDYQQDIVYEIDDIIELVEALEKKSQGRITELLTENVEMKAKGFK